MMPNWTLSFAGATLNCVRRHLFPGDGCEAAAILVCARVPGPRQRLLVRKAVLVPHEDCALREPDRIVWPGIWIEEAIDLAEAENLSLILIHSHPGGLFDFSEADDQSDARVIPGLFEALGSLHGSAIMIPDGRVRGRLYAQDGTCWPINLVSVIGDDIDLTWAGEHLPSKVTDRPVAFTSRMTRELGRLRAVVIGVSGTGSIIGEQAARLGFGRVDLIDFDRIELHNLNRILNATKADAEERRLKVEMFASAVASHRGEGVAMAIPASITSREAVLSASQADVLFCCVDTLEARQMADFIAQAFLLPLFDMGVVIPLRKAARGMAIADVCGRVDYVQPGGSTLRDREVYSPASLRAEYLRRTAPSAHQHELEAGYIKGMIEEAPSVITLNMRVATAAMNEFIARAYPFRLDPNGNYARTEFSLAAGEEEFTAEAAFPRSDLGLLARGDLEPLLGLPLLKPRRAD
ncbi:ThiF family adenylyltransferase [Rhodobacter capsulatus]|uniref:ThiF family adenylyltransferase n=1 Tax=Rhodobacter capsulatus TaxID=1061 RepID=A0A4U1JPR1_RHOCA|nr:ThiF family adenylyltransferase [Rhodobacter capsulatus]TKD15795.1 ThiF family adenylyltransferase [Rhodobacter capsulatus]